MILKSIFLAVYIISAIHYYLAYFRALKEYRNHPNIREEIPTVLFLAVLGMVPVINTILSFLVEPRKNNRD